MCLPSPTVQPQLSEKSQSLEEYGLIEKRVIQKGQPFSLSCNCKVDDHNEGFFPTFHAVTNLAMLVFTVLALVAASVG